MACAILATGVLSLAQLLALAIAQNTSARHTTRAAVFAAQKLEELTADKAGLVRSPAASLGENTIGFVDFIGQNGELLAGVGVVPPRDASYTRRWSIEPSGVDRPNTFVIQTFVTPFRERRARRDRLGLVQGEVRMLTVGTRAGADGAEAAP